MGKGVYVISVLGESPGVLTELLWWLCVRENRSIAGIEVWGTGRGVMRLRELVASEAWRALEAQTGPLPPLLPEGVPPSHSHGFRTHVFRDAAGELNDVRTEEESECVSAVLHDRVRELRAKLGDHILLLGSLAGGRKTVSAALQTAFCMQAGAEDRLVHVLLDAVLEGHLREHRTLHDYLCPTEAWAEASGVAMRDQVTVFDVSFPRLRLLVPRRLAEVLRDREWHDVWPVLSANMGRNAVGRLTRTGRAKWRYLIVDASSGDVVFPADLGRRLGAVLAAMANAVPGATGAELVDWLNDNDVGWRPPTGRGADRESLAGAIRTAVSDLRKQLAGVPVGLERFAPPEQGFAMSGVHVELEWKPVIGGDGGRM